MLSVYFVIKGCASASSSTILCVGSLWQHFDMKSVHSSLRYGGNSSSAVNILCLVARRLFFRANGVVPVQNSKHKIPRHQMSALKSYVSSLHISGGRYSAVPQNVFLFRSLLHTLHPKSASFSFPSQPISIFSGLMSLCITFLECR